MDEYPEEVRRKVIEYAHLAEFLTVLQGTGDLDGLARCAAEKISEIFQSELVFILVEDPATERLEVRASVGLPAGEPPSITELEKHFAGTWEGGLAVKYAGEAPGLVLAGVSVNNMLWVRISRGKNPLGVIGVARKYQLPFGEEEVSLLSTTASSLGLAVENALLNETLRRRAEQREQLAYFSRNMSISLDLDEAMQEACRVAVKLLGMEGAAVGLLGEDGYITLQVAYGDVDEEYFRGVRVHRTESLTGLAFEQDRAVCTEDFQNDPRATYSLTKEYGLRGMLVVPLIAGGEEVGVLYAGSFSPRRFTEEEIELAEILANPIAANIRNARLFEDVQERAIKDGLTDLYNRRFFMEQMELELNRARRSGRPFSLLLMDLDNFKAYNDVLGHTAGDRLLKKTGQRLLENVRSSDTVYRYGGEEFAVILPGTDEDGAWRVAGGIHGCVEEISEDEGPRVSASMGIAMLDPKEADAGDIGSTSLVEQADMALYYAKHLGKDRIEAFSRVPQGFARRRFGGDPNDAEEDRSSQG